MPVGADDEVKAWSKDLAGRLGAEWAGRGKRTLKGISERHGLAGVVVADPRGLKARSPAGRVFTWHPGLAKIRIPGASTGTPDHLVQSVRPRPGMEVLDANLGLAHDALVLASQGARVTGLEVDPIIHALTEDGLKRAPTSDLPVAIRDAASRVRCLLADQREFIPAAADDAYDAVCFSPMFSRPEWVADDMMPLREVAARSWPDEGLLAEALRVSTLVVVKVERGRPLPLPDPSRWQMGGRSHVAYAVYER